MIKDEIISSVLEIIKDESEKADVRQYTCINGFGFSQFERNIAQRTAELLIPKATFTIEEFRNYLLKQDSRGDIMYNLNEANIVAANETEEELSECCTAPIERGLCTFCNEHV